MDSILPRKKIAIVTGASVGLGREFALQLEQKYFLDEIWLVARREEPLKILSETLQKAKGIPLPADLSKDTSFQLISGKLQKENPEIVFLVNNAGLGKIGPFQELSEDEQLQMIDVNVGALTKLTHMALPFCTTGSTIIQVASSIAFCPAPFFAIYAATKAFVLSFSRALEHELRPRGIHVIAICPGPVATEFFAVANTNAFMKNKEAPTKPFNHLLMATAEAVVAKALADADGKKSMSIYGITMNILIRLLNFVPKKLAMKVMANRY